VTRIIANGLQGIDVFDFVETIFDLCVKYAPENMSTNSFLCSGGTKRQIRIWDL